MTATIAQTIPRAISKTAQRLPHFPLETGGGMGYTHSRLARKGGACRFQDRENVRFVKDITLDELYFAIAGDDHR